MTRVVQTIDSLASERGGPVTAAFGLHAALQRLGRSSTILTVGALSMDAAGGVAAAAASGPLGRYGLGRGFFRRALAAAETADFAVLHGVYSFTTIQMFVACRCRRTPFAVVPHGSLKWEAERHPRLKRLADMAYARRLLASAAVVVFASQRELLGTRIPVATNKVRVLPLGVNADAEESRPIPRTGPLSISFVGRLARVKRVDTLIRALSIVARHRSFTCHIVGPAEAGLDKALAQLAAELEVLPQVRFIGQASRLDVSRILSQSDVFVMPSESENFCIAAAEALAAGAELVATDQVGMTEHLDRSEFVRIISVGDHERLAEHLCQVRVDGPSRDRRMAGARSMALAAFNWDVYAGDLLRMMACT